MSIGMQSGRRALTRYVVMKLRAFRRLQRESEYSPFVFVSERGSLAEAFEHTITHRAPNKPPNLAATCSGGSEWEWGYAGR
jgi:hypothetical protein